MQTPDELYSRYTNPANNLQEGFDRDQPEITTPGESEEDPHKIMPIAGANETGADGDETTDDEEEADDAEDEEAEEDAEADNDAKTYPHTAINKSMTTSYDTGGVY